MSVRILALRKTRCFVLATLMLYSIESQSFRRFLLPPKTLSRNWRWYRFWQKIVARMLPGKLDCRGSFLETLLHRIWINLFEYMLRRRSLQMDLGFRKAFTYSESLKIYRGLIYGMLSLADKCPTVTECSFSYVSLLMHFLAGNTGLGMGDIRVPMYNQPLTFQRSPGTYNYQPLEYRLLLIHAALQAAPSYLQNKPLNLNICWSCLQTTKCYHCSECKIVRYCSASCANTDWRCHKLVCASLKDFILVSPLGRKLHKCVNKCVKKLGSAEPLYFCEVLEYVASSAESRQVRRLEELEEKGRVQQKLLALHKLLEDLLSETEL